MNPQTMEGALLHRQGAQRPTQRCSDKWIEETKPVAPRRGAIGQEQAIRKEGSRSPGAQLIHHVSIILNQLKGEAQVHGLKNDRKRC